MLKPRISIFVLLISLAFSPAAVCQEGDGGQITIQEFLDSLDFQAGTITLPGGMADLSLPDSFRYLPPPDAERLLTQGWGNPSGFETLGMIVPTDRNPLGPDGWGVIITYEEDGHVNDDDAGSIDYGELLEDMQQATAEANEERQKQGYEALNLVGWAEQPTYDRANHKLYWAKELASDSSPIHTLNYNIRVLGRKGVMVLNAVAGMDQIDTVKSEMQNVVAFTNFTPGNRYADFDSSTDQVAAYGIAALVAGGAAAKLGLFGKLVALVVAFKKLFIVGLVGLGVLLKNLFGRKKSETL